jgi:hypothetical protein
MRFLTPSGGSSDGFGVLTSPYHGGPTTSIKSGAMWAADNNAFTKGFSPSWFFSWLEKMEPYQASCLFVVVPDAVGNAIQTCSNYRYWVRYFEGWPVAFAAQDGQENLPFPDYFNALFVGGSTEWKESQAAIDCIKRAQALGKHIHIGRVNWKRRYNLFNVLTGSERFTCDGTRNRFDGKDKAHKAWKGYMAQRPLVTI